MVPTSFLFRILDQNGQTLSALTYAPTRSTPEAIKPEEKQITVDVPFGAIAWADGRRVTGGSTIAIRTTAIPEQPYEFRSGTVDFALQSWTDSSLAFYSGTATYEREFNLTADDLKRPLTLDLGRVGLAAEVWLNGTRIGERAWSPFRFDLGSSAAAGVNHLKIRVANSDAGWQSQGDTIYPKGSWGLRYKTELDRQPTIRPNGLEGPVSILR
jgi:hypothetical protein